MKDVGYQNYYTLLNESVMPGKSYYSLFDIRNIIKNNVDFTISRSMYIRNIDKYILEGKIVIFNKRLSFSDKKDYEKFKNIASTLLKQEKEDKK